MNKLKTTFTLLGLFFVLNAKAGLTLTIDKANETLSFSGVQNVPSANFYEWWDNSGSLYGTVLNFSPNPIDNVNGANSLIDVHSNNLYVGVTGSSNLTGNGNTISYSSLTSNEKLYLESLNGSTLISQNSLDPITIVVVSGSNASPLIATNTGGTVAEGGTLTITTSMLNEGDPDDSGAGLTYSVTTASLNGRLELSSAAGISISSFTQADVDSGIVQYVHDSSETTSDSISLSLADGGENGAIAATGTFSITITPVNDAPVATDAAGTLTYTENDAATAIDGSLSLSDNDDVNLEGATISLSANFVSGEDVLAFANTGAISGNWNATSGVLTLTGTDTKANYELALESVTYQNTSEDPSVVSRTVSWVVNDGNNNSAPVTSTISVAAVNDAPLIVTNTGGTVAEGGTLAITTAMLNEGDPDDSGVELTYSVTTASSNGRLELSSAAGTSISSFTQADVDSGIVQYVHDSSETTSDSISLSLADGAEDGATAATGTFSITVTAVNDTPLIATNTGGTVAEGGTLTITTAMLNEGDPDDSGAGLVYSVTAASSNGRLELSSAAGISISSFTQADVDSGMVQYVHDSSQSTSDTISLSLADGGEDGATAVTGIFSITVTAVNDAPLIATNTGGTVVEGGALTITTLMLNEGDPDDSGSGLTYSVTTASSNGRLELSSAVGTSISSFTQADLDLGIVRYVHDGSETTSDSISLSLADGGEDGAAAATGTFSIIITAVNDAPLIATNTGGTVAEGGTLTITTLMLNAGDPDDSGSGLTYSVTTASSNGRLELSSAEGKSISSFTQADVGRAWVREMHEVKQYNRDDRG
jgi:hypothetical protein